MRKLNITDEERKERAKAAKRKYYLANKERQYAKQKADRLANPEKYAAYRKQYRIENSEKLRVYKKNHYQKLKDGLFSVYYLKEEHYVGQTSSIYNRMTHHKFYDRYVKDVEVLAKFETRNEAKAFEAKLHDMGYHGKNNGL